MRTITNTTTVPSEGRIKRYIREKTVPFIKRLLMTVFVWVPIFMPMSVFVFTFLLFLKGSSTGLFQNELRDTFLWLTGSFGPVEQNVSYLKKMDLGGRFITGFIFAFFFLFVRDSVFVLRMMLAVLLSPIFLITWYEHHQSSYVMVEEWVGGQVQTFVLPVTIWLSGQFDWLSEFFGFFATKDQLFVGAIMSVLVAVPLREFIRPLGKMIWWLASLVPWVPIHKFMERYVLYRFVSRIVRLTGAGLRMVGRTLYSLVIWPLQMIYGGIYWLLRPLFKFVWAGPLLAIRILTWPFRKIFGRV